MTRTATIGTTSYGFRYLLMDERRAPPLRSLVGNARGAGLDALQICENARPLQLSAAEWKDVIAAAGNVGLALHLGCMTLDLETLCAYLDRVAELPGADTLRIVLENETGAAPSRDCVVRFLDAAMPRLENSGMKLAIENHFHIPCSMLAEVVSSYPSSRIGFCIDSANSLRSFEPAAEVFRLLCDRVTFYHLKDFRVEGTNVGFSVKGAPLGEGDLDLEGCLDRIYYKHPHPLIFLENWVPQSGDWTRDVAADSEWLTRSLQGLRTALR